MGTLPGQETVGMCKLWAICWPFNSTEMTDAESITLQDQLNLQEQIKFRFSFRALSLTLNLIAQLVENELKIY